MNKGAWPKCRRRAGPSLRGGIQKKHCWNNNWQKKQYQGLDHNSRESVRGRRNNEVSKKMNQIIKEILKNIHFTVQNLQEIRNTFAPN